MAKQPAVKKPRTPTKEKKEFAPWLYFGNPILEAPPEYAGFTYLITYVGNHPLAQGRKYYIGSKIFRHKTVKLAPKKLQVTVKGKARINPVKVRGTKESDWASYFGSNLELKELVRLEPPHLFKREILAFGVTRQQCLYHEAKFIYCEGVLEKDSYFNNWVFARIFRWQAQGLLPPARKPKTV